MNEIELARFCEKALGNVENYWPWAWRHEHADGTVCQEKRLVYEVHPDDWTEAEVATFNAVVKARVGETIVMILDGEMTEPGKFNVYVLPERDPFHLHCPGRKLVGTLIDA